MRNDNSRFAINPTNINISRSRFARTSTHKTTFNVGDLIPFYIDEVLPGDTFDVTTSKIVRMQPMVTPPMDDLYLDTYYFFVPNRLVWSHWKQFQGENTDSAWIPQTTYSIPQITSPAGGWNKGTVADYFGIPIGVANLSVNALPFRAYGLIWNEWFRDQNVMDAGYFTSGDSTVAGYNSRCDSSPGYIERGGLPCRACKLHDYFTSTLPSPQKGPEVLLPITAQGDDWLPVFARSEEHDAKYTHIQTSPPGFDVVPLAFSTGNLASIRAAATRNSTSVDWKQITGTNTPADVADLFSLAPTNLWAGNDATTWGTVNQLRLAFQVQKAFERDARSGTRYVETLKARFGVTSPDARQQRPEYLGGNRLAINVNQIVQQSATAAGSTPQGNPVGLSVTHDSHHDFTHSFTEHGFVIGLMVARYPHTYQQGIERFWSRKTRFDFYEPVLANIGETGVLNKEIFAQGSTVVDADGNIVDNKVFGYQEAWADYRYKPSRVSGQMRSDATGSLDCWHFADDYATLPSLSDSWMREDPNTIDRVLAVSSAVADQLFADIQIKNITTRPMPMYSIPGMLDHN